jgi:hypothetical protein
MFLHWKILQTHILEGGERLGLVVEGEDERLGLVLVMSVYDYTSPSVEEFRARQARTRLY